MDKQSIQKEARLYFIPFLLGNNQSAHRLSKKIYKKHKIICYILDKKKTVADILDYSSKFLRLTEAKNTSLTAEQLIYFADQKPYTLPLLIPCTAEYEQLIEENRELLEASFVLSSKGLALTDSPLNIISQ